MMTVPCEKILWLVVVKGNTVLLKIVALASVSIVSITPYPGLASRRSVQIDDIDRPYRQIQQVDNFEINDAISEDLATDCPIASSSKKSAFFAGAGTRPSNRFMR